MSYLGTNKIGKMYLGSTAIGKAYLGSNLVYQSGSEPGPGPQPTSISYIRGGADGSYIDTGITADNTTRVIVWARNWQPYGEALFGSRTAASNGEFAVCAPSGNSVDRIRARLGSNYAFAESAITNLYTNYHKYELNENRFYVDDVLEATLTSSTFSNNLNIHLFGINTGGTHDSMASPADVCACKIYKNNVLVRDFTAVNSPSIGLYDSVSDTLFTNSGNGSFLYGTFNQDAYTPLEYIECDAAQGFDSGSQVSYSDSVVCKFMPMATSPHFYFLFSAPPSGSTGVRAYVGNASSLNYRFYLEEGSTSAKQLYSSTNPRLSDLEITFASQNNQASLYRNNALLGTQVTTDATSSFETESNLIIGSSNNEYDAANSFIGRIYYLKIGSKRSFVPAKVNNVAGMYDTYNDVFYPSVTGTNFVAGPEL